MSYKPTYIKLYESGELKQRIESLHSIVSSCTLCPHKCRVDRTKGTKGKCKSGILPIISAFSPHFGEEAPLVGTHGSGTIFFTHCNLTCIFCQNYDISHLGRGEEVSYEHLADIMLALQQKGCHNVNLVSPSHMVYAIVQSLELAIPEGLSIPLVYNSGGYDSVETLKLLEGIIDIYMPDFKYMDSHTARELSGAQDYPEVAMAALREMHRQTGDLQLDARRIAYKGLLVRHLVLPNNIAGTDHVIDFIAELSVKTYINIMDQYHPAYRSHECFDLKRRITLDEFDTVLEYARRAGLNRIDKG